MGTIERQRGVTLLGWLFLLIPLATVGYTGIRLVPIYMNYMRVAKSLDQIVTETGAEDTAQSIRFSIEKRFDIESINFPDFRDVDIRRDGTSWVLEAKYEDTAPLFSNVSILVSFDKVAQSGG
ncbi:MAG TPA: DUF4845 domain-containing protein [Steroidobacteraceae bacterium]|nr:DUF4845 domain-containing protein [Steroidobacteraceae bacterium]